ncbi:MAG: hypothetical protein ABI567_08955 [Gammaproteobacteria bacterium]
MRTRTPVSGPAPPVHAGLALLFALAASLASAGQAGQAEVRLDPARVGWSEVRMTATKLFLTAEARLTLRTVPGASVLPDLLAIQAEGFTPLPPGDSVLELIYDAQGIGRQSRLTLLMDPASGAALQQTNHDQDAKPRLRIYRFGAQGAYQRTRWPATPDERTLLPPRWTRTSEGLRAYPVPPGGQPVVEPTGLLYAIAAAPLDRPGDSIDLLIFSRRDTRTVRIAVLPPREVSVRYDELWPRGAVQRTGTVRALRLSLTGLPVQGSSAGDDDLELLGLRGQLELLLEPATRAPLQLSGDLKIVGRVTLNLTAVRPR